MLHALFYTNCFVFAYTSWNFYAFSGTNLLTTCHSATSRFLLFLCFRKVTQEIFSKLDKMKAKVPIYLTRRQSPKERRRRPRRWRHQVVWAPGLPPDIALSPISSLHRDNPRGPITFPRNILKPPPSSTQDQEGPEALPGTMPERGIITGGLLHHHAIFRSDA
jgi:hypothetical protein